VDQLVKRYLSNPVRHSVDDAAAPPPQMTHHILAVRDADAKKQVVHQLASGTGRRVLFMRTKHQAKKLAKQLTAAGVPAVDLHGNLGQNARERNLEAFSTGAVKVLVATDIAARGIHVDDVELVVHVDPPAEHKAYLHRSGRTARAGSEGVVVTVMLPEQRGDMRDLARKARITAQPQQTEPGDAAIAALVGEVAEYVRPTTVTPAQTQPRRGTPSSNGGSRANRRGAGSGADRSSASGAAGRTSAPAAGSTRGGGRTAAGAGANGGGGASRGASAGRAGGASGERRRGGRGRAQRSAGGSGPTTYTTSTPR
jgi:superfamily II DNA/RNA helicase